MFHIVAIGASAGGLEALQQFFEAMPPDNGMGFVVIQHLSSDYKSMMAEILSEYTVMPVRQAEDGTEVVPEHVYLIPPEKSMAITDGRLRLTEKVRQGGPVLPIDTFFHSLARERGEHAIAVVLSGTGNDGTLGIRGIKEQDGMVLVQSLASAKFDGMPQSAIHTGLADSILAPAEMPAVLLNAVHHLPVMDVTGFFRNPKVESELEELDEILDNLMRCSRVAMLFLDRNLCIRRFTPAMREYMPLLDSDIGRPLEDLHSRLQYPGLYQDLRAVMADNRSRDVEIEGEQDHWYMAQLSPYLTRDGEVQGSILNLVDISERKRSEQRIQDAQERLRLATETGGSGRGVNWGETGEVRDAQALEQAQNRLQAAEHFIRATIDSLAAYLCVVDENGMILMVNRAWREFADANPPVPITYCEGSNYLQVCDQSSGPGSVEAGSFALGLRSVLNGEQDAFQMTYPCPSDTEPRWFQASVARFDEDDRVRAVVIHENITERVLAEHNLRALNRDFTTLLENTTDFIYFKDQNSRFRFCSQTLADITGHLRWQDLIGKHDVEVFPPNTAKIYYEEELPIFERGKPLLNKIDPYYDAQGRQGWVDTSKWPVFGPDGKVVGIFGISRDITAIKQVQLELERAKEAAEAASHAKSAFLANISHELRTPLNAVLGYAQILQRDAALTAEQRQSVETIKRSGDYLLVLINDVLDLAKIETGRLELQPEPCETERFFAELSELFELHALDKGIAFHYQPSATLPPALEVDPKRLRQVCMNLLGNAVKFTDQGEVRLETDYRDGNLFIRVRDTGIGIPAELLETIFQPFHQAYKDQYKQQGTGLGLAISRNLIRQMDGGIEVESEAGAGSCFTIRIPLAAVEPPRSTVTLDGQTLDNLTDYRDEDVPSPAPPDLPGESIQPATTDALSAASLAALKQSVTHGERQKILDLLSDLKSQNAALAAMLQSWGDAYEYQRILDWIENIRQNQEER